MNSTAKRTWVEIDLDALDNNFRNIRACVPDGCKIMSVIKAGAYGHGATRIAAELEPQTDWFAVSNTDEAMQLRRAGIRKPVLILGYSDPEQIPFLADNDITQTVYSEEYAGRIAEKLNACGKKISVHIKIDTGMNRIGFPAYSDSDAENSAEIIARIHEKYPCLEFNGIFSHFAVADSLSGDFTTTQFARFTSVVEKLRLKGLTFALRHICNSAAIINDPEMHLDMVRPGLILYGLYPDEVRKDIGLIPVMQLKSVVSHVHTLRKGETVSYGRLFTAPEDMKIATVPVGYADGLFRTLSGDTEFFIAGSVNRKVPQIGRICMDQCMLDVTGLDVRQDDEVTVFGREPRVDELAAAAGTIPYELICAVSPRVPRVYLKNGRIVDVMTYHSEEERPFAGDGTLEGLRKNIDTVDAALADLFSKRMTLVQKVSDIKKSEDLPVCDPGREKLIIEKNSSLVPSEYRSDFEDIYSRIIEKSREYQQKLSAPNPLFGLLGHPLGHSWSKPVHEMLTGKAYDYKLLDVEKAELERFLTEKNFSAVNVTIPYKETVIPFCDSVSEQALEVGSVNCIVNRNGKLYGFNTDVAGFSYLLDRNGIDLKGKKVLILGTGGTFRTVAAVAGLRNASEILAVSRHSSGKDVKGVKFIGYDEIEQAADADILVNTTPVGMFPNTENCPADLGIFVNLSAVIDVIYNPDRTKLLTCAEEKGIKNVNGLQMLVAQAKYAAELFLGNRIGDSEIEKVTARIREEIARK